MELGTSAQKLDDSIQLNQKGPETTQQPSTPFASDGDESHTADEPRARPIGRVRLVLLIFGLCLAVFCVALDNTILATAMPTISHQFKTIEDVGWYGSIYFLGICSVTLLFGRLYSLYSLKFVFLIAVGIFEVGSLLCGVTPSSAGLIVGRAVAGVGSGGILPGAILIICESVALHRRAAFNGLVSGMAGVAAVVGPLIGGAFTVKTTWRWCFYINLPIGAITILVVLLFFHESPRSSGERVSPGETVRKLDLPGLVLFISAICCLMLALQWGGSKYEWRNARIVVLWVLLGVLFIAWCVLQRWQQENATIPPRLIAQRNVWAGALFALFFCGAYYGMAYYLPIWFQVVKDASPLKSGIMNVPMIIAFTIFSVLGGLMVNFSGYYAPFMYVATIILAVGCGMCSTFKVSSGAGQWIGYQALVGIGAGFGFHLPFIAIQAALPKRDAATGTAIIVFGQNLSSALFVAISQNIFQTRLLSHVQHYAPSVDPQKVIAAGAANLAHSFSQADLPSLKLAYNAAVTETFYVPVAGAALAIIGAVFMQSLNIKRAHSSQDNAAVYDKE